MTAQRVDELIVFNMDSEKEELRELLPPSETVRFVPPEIDPLGGCTRVMTAGACKMITRAVGETLGSHSSKRPSLAVI